MSIPLIGDSEPTIPCQICGERVGQHLTMKKGKPQMACCRCHIFKNGGMPVEWHKECPGYFKEKYGREAGQNKPSPIILPKGPPPV